MSPKEIFHANPDCICTLDGQGTVLSINPRGVQLWEFDSASDGLGKNYADLWLTEERERILDAIDEALAGRASVMEGFCVTPKGNRYWWETRFLPIDSKSNGTERIMCISRDFSQRQQIQLSHSAQEIKDRAQNALYREIIDSAIETAIIGTDTEGRIVLWSEGAHQITGWDDEEMLGRPLATILHPKIVPLDAPSWRCNVRPIPGAPRICGGTSARMAAASLRMVRSIPFWGPPRVT